MGVSEREERLQKIDQSKIIIISDIKNIEKQRLTVKTFKIAEVDQIFVLLGQGKNKTLLTLRILTERKPLSKSLVDKLSKKK